MTRADAPEPAPAVSHLGTVSTLDVLTDAAHSIAYDADDGHYYVLSSVYLERIENDGTETQITNFFSNGYPDTVVWDPNAHVFYVSCTNGYQIVQVTPQGQNTVLAGGTYGTKDGTGTGAQFQYPSGMVLDTTGATLYIADNDRMRAVAIASRKVTTVGPPGTLSGNAFGQSHSVALDTTDGDLAITDPPTERVLSQTPSIGTYQLLAGRCIPKPGSATCAPLQVDGVGGSALFGLPAAIVYASAADAFLVADEQNFSVRRLLPKGGVYTMAGSGRPAIIDGTGVGASFTNPACAALDPTTGLALICDNNGSDIRSVTMTGFKIRPPRHSFALRTAPTIESGPSGLARTGDGSFWFAESLGGYVGRVLPTGSIHEYVLPPGHSDPYGLALGVDGNAWFADYSNPNQFGAPTQTNIASITSNGIVHSRPIPNHCQPTFPSAPSSLAFEPSGDVWFVASCPTSIGFMTPRGVVTEFVAPPLGGLAVDAATHIWAGDASSAHVYEYSSAGRLMQTFNGAADAGIAVGADQTIWLLSNTNQTVTDLDPSNGNLKIHQLPNCNCNRLLQNLRVGPDGTIWFTESSLAGYLGAAVHMTASGAFKEYPTYEPRSGPSAIAFDASGLPWIADAGAEKIGPMRSLP